MVVIRSDLDAKLERFFYNSVQGPLEEFCSHSACDGIKDDPDNANKARMNHYGWVRFYPNKGSVMVPPRQFIQAAIKDANSDKSWGMFNADEIRNLLVKKINKQPRVQKQDWGSGTGAAYRTTLQRALSPVKGDPNDEKYWKKVSNIMAERLRAAINSTEIVGERHNAESTKKRKGFDHVLVDTKDMIGSIKGWTE